MSTSPETDTLFIFVDEAGDSTLFANRRRSIVGANGCSRYFIIGKLEVDDPAGLSHRMTELRRELLAHPYFQGVPSFDPARKKTSVMFHAKDDLPEVRYQVFDLLVREGDNLRFHAVVSDKEAVLKTVRERNASDPGYHYHHNELYDRLMRLLFGKFHRLADDYEVCVARRGDRDRNEALRNAIDHAERDFEATFGFGRGGQDAWRIRVSTPRNDVCLQAADYFLWAIQRLFEPRTDASGNSLREERFVKLLWPQIGEIHDLNYGTAYGTFFNKQRPLSLEVRFAEAGKQAKKKP